MGYLPNLNWSNKVFIVFPVNSFRCGSIHLADLKPSRVVTRTTTTVLFFLFLVGFATWYELLICFWLCWCIMVWFWLFCFLFIPLLVLLLVFFLLWCICCSCRYCCSYSSSCSFCSWCFCWSISFLFLVDADPLVPLSVFYLFHMSCNKNGKT